jgi:hypothetical protein
MFDGFSLKQVMAGATAIALGIGLMSAPRIAKNIATGGIEPVYGQNCANLKGGKDRCYSQKPVTAGISPP